MCSVGRLPSWLSLDTPVGGWIKVQNCWHLDGCEHDQASGELRPGRLRWMGWRRVVMIRTEMTTDSSRAEHRFKKVLAVRKKRAASNSGACTHSSQPTLFQIYTGEKQTNKQRSLKSSILKVWEHISSFVFLYLFLYGYFIVLSSHTEFRNTVIQHFFELYCSIK